MGALGDRMKVYEAVPQVQLTRRTPAIVRIDGKSFHTFTRGMEKPWDARIEGVMQATMESLCKAIDGCVFAYCQSDEISLLLVDYRRFTSQPWFDKNVQKIASVSASLATAAFNYAWLAQVSPLASKPAVFDSRVFVLPREEVNNYFLWRQQDATRNSVLGLAQKYFSHAKLHNQNSSAMQEMLFHEHGVNWNDTPTYRKRGVACHRVGDESEARWAIDLDAPVFSTFPGYVQQWVYPPDEEGGSRIVRDAEGEPETEFAAVVKAGQG